MVVVRKAGRGHGLYDPSKDSNASSSQDSEESEAEREESEVDEADDRGAGGASKRARALVNDRRRLHLNNGFVDLNQKFPHGLFLDEDYKK